MEQMVLYCKSYYLFNMFQAPLCPSSGAQEYYADGCCLLQHPANRSHNLQLHTRPTTCKPKTPSTTGSNHLHNTLKLLMMGIVVPETC